MTADRPDADARVYYAASVHDDREIDAVVEVLRDPRGLWVGKRVNQMERRVAALFGKGAGVMVNSGSSALYLAVELMGLPPGAEVIVPAVTFSTDIAPLVRAGLVPSFVDVEPDTYNIDVELVDAAVTPATRAILAANLIGNVPDWDALRAVADRHGLWLVEDSCDAMGPTLRGTPTGARSDLTVTSFASSHVITCAGGGGMLMLDDDGLRDRALLLRRWGRRSELHFFGSKRRDRTFWEDLDGVAYDNQFIFDEVAWNFEPSELGAAFGLVQLDKLDANLARRQRNFRLYSEFLAPYAGRLLAPRQPEGVDTAWLCYPVTILDGAGIERADVQQFLDARGIDTRTVWTGNATRQPMLRGVPWKAPEAGLPNADRIFAAGFVLPCNHGMDDAAVGYVTSALAELLDRA
ncbi:MAG TPA: DegT/DnrJ/EryC1/StrS family aminotransferase [Acidimicrobiales bacterium]|nr:DegT/DnrJ/EryC1/StrS family aminotransferase [Acidimicrobiales bacterium]